MAVGPRPTIKILNVQHEINIKVPINIIFFTKYCEGKKNITGSVIKPFYELEILFAILC